MNAQTKLDAANVTIRNLTIERDALKSKCEVQRKALAHEAMETVKLRAELDALKQAAAETLNWMNNAPFDYSNGNVAQGVDEGNYYGWRGHKEVVNKLAGLLK